MLKVSCKAEVKIMLNSELCPKSLNYQASFAVIQSFKAFLNFLGCVCRGNDSRNN